MASKAMLSLRKTGNKALTSVKKHSPELLLAGGVIAGVATVVTACRATLKVNDILDDHQDRMEEIRRSFDPDSKEIKKATTKAYIKTGWEFAKEFGLSAALGATAVACNVASFKIQKHRNIELTKENAALTATCLTLSETIRKYRERWKEKVGEEVENEVWNNLSDIEITRDYVDEKGKKKTEKKKTKVVGPDGASPYARYITKTNPDYHKDPAVMAMYMRAQTAHMNDTKNCRKSGIFTYAEALAVCNLDECAEDFDICWGPNSTIETTLTPVALPIIDGEGVWNGEYDDAYLIDFNCLDSLAVLRKQLEE